MNLPSEDVLPSMALCSIAVLLLTAILQCCGLLPVTVHDCYHCMLSYVLLKKQPDHSWS